MGEHFPQNFIMKGQSVSIWGRIISTLNFNEYPSFITLKIYFHDAYQFTASGQLPKCA